MPEYYFAAAVLAVLSLAYYLFLQLYPKPLAGIPYQQSSVKRLLGDVFELKRVSEETREPSLSMFAIARRLRVPVCQVLISSFTNPLIVIDDAREAEDILLRRNREFDRSPLTTELFELVVPHSTLAQLTTPALKAQKRLWSDVMSADFLRRVVAPNIHRSAGDLIDIWKIRAKKAHGDPIDVSGDFGLTALDAIWVAILGSDLGVIRREIEKLEPPPGGLADDPERMKRLHTATKLQEAVECANWVVDEGLAAIWPAFTRLMIRLTPSYRRFMRLINDEVTHLMIQSCERFRRIEGLGDKDGEEHDTCAMDLVLRREIVTAKKNGQPLPDPTKDPAMLDELLLLLMAGHDSTANTLMWFVKFMTLYPESQAELRKAVQAAFPSGFPESAAAILDADIPYLDASVEETLRVSGTASVVARVVLMDTEILGHRIPKGANIILNTRLIHPPEPVSEDLRSSTSRMAKAKRPRGGLDGESGRELGRYEPRRWLTTNEQGKEVYDAYALPSLVFGGGLRGCFGKRLAVQELKIIMVHLILSFEFLPLPEELSSFEAIERVFRAPKMCYVKLKAL